MGNPLLDRLAKMGTSGHGRASEKRVAKSMGARLHPGSGAFQGHKSDASDEAYQYEMKSTKNLTLPLERAWLEKITHEANQKNKIPALVLSFVSPEGRPQVGLNPEWVAIPKWAFEELIHGSD